MLESHTIFGDAAERIFGQLGRVATYKATGTGVGVAVTIIVSPQDPVSNREFSGMRNPGFKFSLRTRQVTARPAVGVATFVVDGVTYATQDVQVDTAGAAWECDAYAVTP